MDMDRGRSPGALSDLSGTSSLLFGDYPTPSRPPLRVSALTASAATTRAAPTSRSRGASESAPRPTAAAATVAARSTSDTGGQRAMAMLSLAGNAAQPSAAPILLLRAAPSSSAIHPAITTTTTTATTTTTTHASAAGRSSSCAAPHGPRSSLPSSSHLVEDRPMLPPSYASGPHVPLLRVAAASAPPFATVTTSKNFPLLRLPSAAIPEVAQRLPTLQLPARTVTAARGHDPYPQYTLLPMQRAPAPQPLALLRLDRPEERTAVKAKGIWGDRERGNHGASGDAAGDGRRGDGGARNSADERIDVVAPVPVAAAAKLSADSSPTHTTATTTTTTAAITTTYSASAPGMTATTANSAARVLRRSRQQEQQDPRMETLHVHNHDSDGPPSPSAFSPIRPVAANQGSLGFSPPTLTSTALRPRAARRVDDREVGVHRADEEGTRVEALRNGGEEEVDGEGYERSAIEREEEGGDDLGKTQTLSGPRQPSPGHTNLQPLPQPNFAVAPSTGSASAPKALNTTATSTTSRPSAIANPISSGATVSAASGTAAAKRPHASSTSAAETQTTALPSSSLAESSPVDAGVQCDVFDRMDMDPPHTDRATHARRVAVEGAVHAGGSAGDGDDADMDGKDGDMAGAAGAGKGPLPLGVSAGYLGLGHSVAFAAAQAMRADSVPSSPLLPGPAAPAAFAADDTLLSILRDPARQPTVATTGFPLHNFQPPHVAATVPLTTVVPPDLLANMGLAGADGGGAGQPSFLSVVDVRMQVPVQSKGVEWGQDSDIEEEHGEEGEEGVVSEED